MNRLEVSINTLEEEVMSWLDCNELQVLQKVHDLEQQLADQKQDVQKRGEANKRYVEEMSTTVMIKVEAQLHDLGESLLDCMNR